MVKITGEYQGDLHCQATHGPSGRTLETDAPVDNQRRGERSRRPTWWPRRGNVHAHRHGMAARRLGVDIKGARFEVTKEMSADLPRRIARLETQIWLPVPRSADPNGILERAAHTCPVHQSLHPSMAMPVVLHWKE